MLVTESQREGGDEDGAETVLLKEYHCVVCHTFVRSEDVKPQEDDRHKHGGV